MKPENILLNLYNEMIEGRKVLEHNNSILTVNPYYYNGMWVFDDDRVGLVKEPFVAGADDLIDHMLEKNNVLKQAREKGFTLIVSDKPFPGNNVLQLLFKNFGYGGTFYEVDKKSKYSDFKSKEGLNELWLCPALNLYYPESPNTLFFDFKIS